VSLGRPGRAAGRGHQDGADRGRRDPWRYRGERNAKFDPRIVPRHARRVEVLNDAIVRLHARGLITG
jgi:hypothetical protein